LKALKEKVPIRGAAGVPSRERCESDNATLVEPTAETRLDQAEKIFREGNALEAMSLHAEAEARYQEALRIYPESSGGHIQLGNLLFHLHRVDEALGCYAKALALNPQSAGALYSLARIHFERGRLQDAARLLDRAVAVDSEFEQATLLNGIVHERIGETRLAADLYRRASEISPRNRDALMGLAMTQKKLGNLEDAYAAVQRSLSIVPDDAEACALNGLIEVKLGLVAKGVESLRKAVELEPGSASFHSFLLFNLNYLPDISQAELVGEHLKYGARFRVAEPPQRTRTKTALARHRRLNIGYVSGDLREHVVARFLAPILAHHDKSRYRVVAYCNNGASDAMTEALRRCVDQWRDIEKMSDDEVVKMVDGDHIDILVDLAGHTTNNRLQVFARKPAAVQATWLGYLNTTGLAAMDYQICDAYTNPPDEGLQGRVEEPARMPACQWCMPKVDDLPPENSLPMLSKGHVTFGSFNNLAKVNDRVVEVWAAILRELPDAKLIVFGVPSSRAEDQMRTMFGASGVDAGRLDLRTLSDRRTYNLGYHEVDIALDPFPYNGGTTSFDSLAMGVPFITLAGDRPMARGGLSILMNVGLPELVANSPAQYVAIARALATDQPRLQMLRAGLRSRLAQSPPGDVARFTRDLEALYRTWWWRYCDSCAT
jgi:protein O-GlcNAc transferase